MVFYVQPKSRVGKHIENKLVFSYIWLRTKKYANAITTRKKHNIKWKMKIQFIYVWSK